MRSPLFLLLFLLLFLFLGSTALAESPGRAASDFGYRYFQTQSGDTNIVVSPFSIHAAFSMLALGTAGETRNETLAVLKLDPNFGEDYANFLKRLEPEAGKLSLASKAWPSTKFKLLPEFTKACELAFGAAPETTDYSNPESARAKINAWVGEKTEKEITELIPPGGVRSDTELTLSNALYFEGKWANAFDPNSTEPGPFYSPTGEVTVPMMAATLPVAYHNDETFEAVSLPYVDSELAMGLVVPKERNGWKSVSPKLGLAVESLEQDALSQERNAVNQGHIRLSMPKFKVSQSSKPLPALRKMGMVKVLGGEADFSKLGTPGGVSVGNCFHQAVVEVDEKGTKAAAATAIMVTRSLPTIKAEVKVDRPFFFVIYHRPSLAPLFIGQVTTPK
jgi:serpin B